MPVQVPRTTQMPTSASQPDLLRRDTAVFVTSSPILGPLTTTFTPPPSCKSLIGGCDTASCGIFWQGQTCVSTGAQDDQSCWPPTSPGAPSPGSTLFGWGVYSPGIVCPSGFATACHSTYDGTGGFQFFQYSLTAGETAVGCCPKGYGCANINGNTCTLSPTSTVIAAMQCQNGTADFRETTTLSGTSPPAFAPMYQLNHQSSDLPSTSPNWRKIGGAIGGPIGGLLLVLAGGYWIWRKKRRHHQAPICELAELTRPAVERQAQNGSPPMSAADNSSQALGELNAPVSSLPGRGLSRQPSGGSNFEMLLEPLCP